MWDEKLKWNWLEWRMFRRLSEEALEEWQEGCYYFSGEMGTQGEGYLLEKLGVVEGSCVKSVLARLKDEEKSIPQLH